MKNCKINQNIFHCVFTYVSETVTSIYANKLNERLLRLMGFYRVNDCLSQLCCLHIAFNSIVIFTPARRPKP